jgi:hypothetical protein
LVERDALQLMTGAQWLQLLYRHIPDRYEHLVRYVGWYSNRVRSQRAANDAHAPMAQDQTEPEVADRAKAAWARLIRNSAAGIVPSSWVSTWESPMV